MTLKSSTQSNPNQSVFLTPFHRLPLLITAIGLGGIPLPINHWLTILVSSFGLFLLLQSFTLKLEFTNEDLVVWQLGRELRRFPFKNWLAWRLFFPELPGILYFRELASPHLLPILFDPKQLESQLRLRVGALETVTSPKNNSPSPKN